MASRKVFAHGSVVVDVINDWLDKRPDFGLIEIAERVGVVKSAGCFMSQIRSGRSKLPISKVIPLAQVLEQDPKPLVAAVLEEYYPDLKEALIKADMLNDQGDHALVDLREIVARQREADVTREHQLKAEKNRTKQKNVG